MMRHFLDIVHHRVQFPLPIDLFPAPQGEPVHPLVPADIAEDRFHRRKAPGDHFSPLVAVDPSLHPVGVAFHPSVNAAVAFLAADGWTERRTYGDCKLADADVNGNYMIGLSITLQREG